MAAGIPTKIETKKLIWNKGEEYAPTEVNVADGALLTPGNDEATLIILSSTAAVTATIKAGDGIQGVSDITVSVGANKTAYVAVESGRFKITKGANAGKIKVTTSAAGLSAGCIVLPR